MSRLDGIRLGYVASFVQRYPDFSSRLARAHYLAGIHCCRERTRSLPACVGSHDVKSDEDVTV